MYCSACDEVLVDNITIPATGVHTEVSIPGREATCTEEGLTAKRGRSAHHPGHLRIPYGQRPFCGRCQGKTILKKHPPQTAWGGCFFTGDQKSMGLHSTSMIRSFLLSRMALLMQKTE